MTSTESDWEDGEIPATKRAKKIPAKVKAKPEPIPAPFTDAEIQRMIDRGYHLTTKVCISDLPVFLRDLIRQQQANSTDGPVNHDYDDDYEEDDEADPYVGIRFCLGHRALSFDELKKALSNYTLLALVKRTGFRVGSFSPMHIRTNKEVARDFFEFNEESNQPQCLQDLPENSTNLSIIEIDISDLNSMKVTSPLFQIQPNSYRSVLDWNIIKPPNLENCVSDLAKRVTRTSRLVIINFPFEKHNLSDTNTIEGQTLWIYTSTRSSDAMCVVTSGSEALSFTEYEELYNRVSKDVLIQTWFNEQIRVFESNHKKLLDRYQRLQSELCAASMAMGQSNILYQQLHEMGPTWFSRALSGLDKIAGVKAIDYTRKGLSIVTEDIWWPDARFDGVKYPAKYVGCFKFVLDLSTNSCTVQNLCLHNTNQRVHTNQTSGSICLGSYAELFSSALARMDLETVVLTLLEFVRNPHLEDSFARGNYNGFKDHKPLNPVPSGIYGMF